MEVCETDTILIWVCVEGYIPDLGVPEYQKVENPWIRQLLLRRKISNHPNPKLRDFSMCHCDIDLSNKDVQLPVILLIQY